MLFYKQYFYKQHFVSNVRLKLEKNIAKTKQQSETELSHLKIIRIFHSRYQPKIFGHILKNNKCVCIHEIMRLVIMRMKIKMNKISHR